MIENLSNIDYTQIMRKRSDDSLTEKLIRIIEYEIFQVLRE